MSPRSLPKAAALLGLLAFGSITSCERIKSFTNPPPPTVAPLPATVRDLSESEFPALVATPDQLVVVVFHADWCGPCHTLKPVLNEVAEAYKGQVLVGRFDVDQCQQLAADQGIRSIPDVRFFRGGKQVDRFSGLLSKGDLHGKFKALTAGILPKSAPQTDAEGKLIEEKGSMAPMDKDWTPPGIQRLQDQGAQARRAASNSR
jgi:thioredoxin 1